MRRRLVRAGRTAARGGLRGILLIIPLPLLQRLRTAFVRTTEYSPSHRLLRSLLHVARYRGVPKDVDQFPLLDNTSVHFVNADSYIVEVLYWFGERYGYEPEVLHWWRHCSSNAQSILELGANIGYFSVQGALANPSARYRAIEPHPYCATICRRNLELNGIDWVDVIEVAAVAHSRESSAALYLPGLRDHYAAPCTGFMGGNDIRSETSCVDALSVQVVEMKALLDDADLIKLDVEGLEYQLLSSALETICAKKPTIFVELLDSTNRLRGLIAQLCTESNYTCLVPTRETLIRLPPASLAAVRMKEEYGNRDLILTCDPGTLALAGRQSAR